MDDMKELGIVIRDSKIVVSSRDVARVFEKEHKHVLESIRGLDCPEEFNRSNFRPVYKTVNGVQVGTGFGTLKLTTFEANDSRKLTT